MKTKKILCLIDGLCLGGAERQLIGLASLLQKRDYDVTLAYYHNMNFYSDQLTEKGFHSVLIDVGQGTARKVWRVIKFIKRGSFDTVIAYKQGPNMIACLAKIAGERFKLIVSDRYTVQIITRKDRCQYYLYRWADHVVPNAESQKRFICNNFPNLASKVVTITNFTDTKHFSPFTKIDDYCKIKIVTAARISKQKNVMNYLRAIKQVTDHRMDVEFEWYGNVQIGEEDYYNECMSVVRDLGIDKVFCFHRATNDIVKVYQKCDIFCLPSLFEGFPNALCEAMSCGKPILCSKVCDNPQIVNEGENGLMFDPKDVEGMSQVIMKMLSLTMEERTVMGLRSRHLAEERFSEKAFVGKYIRLIESE